MRENETLTSFTVRFIWRGPYRQEVERPDRKWKVSHHNNIIMVHSKESTAL